MRLVQDRWFPFIDLAFAVAGAALWFGAAGSLSWQPLLFVLLPWGMRLLAWQFPFQRTPLDSYIIMFLLTAVLGIWVAYDREAAWSKFWILLSAVFIFYALAGHSRREIWMVVAGLAAIGAGIALYFLLTNDWRVIPADIALLQRVGLRWMQIRPSFPSFGIHPNAVGGLIAILIPFQAALGLYGWRRKKWELVVITAVFGLITLLGFVMTSSRAAWLSVGVALGLWGLWGISQRIAPKTRFTDEGFYLLLLAGIGVVGITAVFLLGGPLSLLARLPGPDNTTSRLELIQRTLQLWQDFPYTGGGLAAFAGLYSNYIAVTPFFLFSYGHNFLLDVLLEQGILGLIALFGIFVGAARLLLPTDDQWEHRVAREVRIFRWATLIGLVTMGLHGLMEDALYGTLGTPLLLLLPGMGVALSGKDRKTTRPVFSKRLWTVVSIVLVVGAIFFYRPLLASWYANLGAVAMTRAELANWPLNEWDDGRNVASLKPSAVFFEQALVLNPLNRTAHHRLGLIALLERDYETAVSHLNTAYQINSAHRGITKSYGYALIWRGQLAESAVILVTIPEARQEMNNYTRWWQQNGRADLSTHASQMVTLLQE